MRPVKSGNTIGTQSVLNLNLCYVLVFLPPRIRFQVFLPHRPHVLSDFALILMIIKARIAFLKKGVSTNIFPRAGAWAHQCSPVAWGGLGDLILAPHGDLWGLIPRTRPPGGPVSLRLWEGCGHSGKSLSSYSLLKPGTWAPQSGNPPGPLGAHPDIWGFTLPTGGSSCPLESHPPV